MELLPSTIRYSQNSIRNIFFDGILIGDTLDNICDGSESIHDIPTISVAKVGTQWFTADNRRLWVFKELEKLGKCSEIPVNVIDNIPADKMTTKNGGESVNVRGDPRVSNYDSDDSDIWDNSDD